MKLTARERKLVFVLPAIFVAVGYGWWYGFSLRPREVQARRDYEAAVAGAVPESAVAQQQAAFAKLQQQMKELTAAKTRLDADAATLAGHAVRAAARLEANQKLASVFRRHHLHLIEESDSAAREGSPAAAKLPTSLTEAQKRLEPKDKHGAAVNETAADKAARSAQLRTYKLVGQFIDVLAAVSELADQAAPPGVPLSLSMAAAEGDSPQQTWTLVIWM